MCVCVCVCVCTLGMCQNPFDHNNTCTCHGGYDKCILGLGCPAQTVANAVKGTWGCSADVYCHQVALNLPNLVLFSLLLLLLLLLLLRVCGAAVSGCEDNNCTAAQCAAQ